MVVSNQNTASGIIIVNGRNLDIVCKYIYLGTQLTGDWNNQTEIKTRIEVARSSFNSMQKTLRDRILIVSLDTRLLQCYVCAILLWGCEA